MANTVVRPLSYTGTVESLTWTQGINVPVRAYLWGGGGGGGGNDSNSGGSGSGGGYAEVSFNLNSGDTIQVVVGGCGGPGASGVAGSGGGFAGASYLTAGTIFNTRTAAASPPTFALFNSNYCSFLNTYGVWESNTRTLDFDRTYTVTFPSTGLYTFTGSSDNSAVYYLDGTALFSSDTFKNTFEQPVQVGIGTHTVRIVALNTGGPGSVALTISGGVNYSGSRGGNAGGSGSSGAGGGSGGATVLLLNGTVLGVAGGGGGGGGGGNTGAATGQSAPGARGQAVFPITNGQNGTNTSGDGGGGGGGGGGYNGGNGGQTPGGDIGGEAGSFGSSYSNIGITADPSNRQPAYQASGAKYWTADRAAGGSPRAQGTVGYAVLEFDVLGSFVKDAGAWQPIDTAYIKSSGSWRQIQATYVKQAGVWQPIFGSFSPTTSQNAAQVGVNPREADGNAGQGGGGGSSKIICTKLYELGLMDKDIYLADQAFGAKLIQSHPDIYNGYRAWAEIVVDWMNGSGPKMMPWMSDQQFSAAAKKWSVSWAQDIATPWAESMAYQMGQRESDNFTGKMITLVGTPICKVVGVWQRVFGRSQQPAGFVKGAMLIPVFVLLKIVAVLGKLIQRR